MVDDCQGIDFTRNKNQIKPWETTFMNKILMHDQWPFEVVVVFYSVLCFQQYFLFSCQRFLCLCLMWRILDDMGLSCFQEEFGSLKMLIPVFSVDFGVYIYS